MPRIRLVHVAAALAVSLGIGAALAPAIVTLGTCGREVERMSASLAELEARIAPMHAQREGWPLPVSPAGQPMFGADEGLLLYGPSSDDAWPELADELERLEGGRASGRWQWSPGGRPPLYLALHSDVRLEHHWPALQRLAGEFELRLIVASPEPPLPRAPAPAWLEEALAGRVLTAESGSERVAQLVDLFEVADRCPRVVYVNGQGGFSWGLRFIVARERAEACHCFMFDEEAVTALFWRALAPQGPPQRWLPLRIAVTEAEQRRVAERRGDIDFDPADPTELLLPGTATVERLIEASSWGRAPLVHLGAPQRGPLFNPLVDYDAWARGKGRR